MQPGINNTSWQPAWNCGKTKVIRVPIVLADQILDYARKLDSLPHQNTAPVFSGVFSHQQIVLAALQKYIDLKRQNYHPNQHSTNLDIKTRSWDEFRKFRSIVRNQPQSLL